MRFYWLLFTLQKHENRTESIRIQLKRLATAQLPNRLVSFLQRGRRLEPNFFLDRPESQDPKFISPPGEKKIGGNLRWLKDRIFYLVKNAESRGSPLCGRKVPDIDTVWSSGRGMWWGSPPKEYRKAGLGYPELSRPPRESSVVYLELHRALPCPDH